jgi:hypothetical protein
MSAVSLGQHHGSGPLRRKQIPLPQAIGLSWSSHEPLAYLTGSAGARSNPRTTGSAGQYEPGHRPAATPPPAPPRRQGRHHLKPAAAFRIPASRVKLRRPRTAVIGHLHTDKTVPRTDRDRDCPARIPRPAIPDTIAEQLAHQQGGVIRAGVPGTEHRDCERAGDSPTLRPPGQRHALPDHRPGHQRTRPPARAPRGKATGVVRTHRDARSTPRLTSSRTTQPVRPWPSAQSPSRLDLEELSPQLTPVPRGGSQPGPGGYVRRSRHG